MGARPREARAGPPAPGAAVAGATPPADPRLDRLERLGRLRESGLLDAAEYNREKTRVLAEAPQS
jgi:Short C-terminal domain